MLVLMTFFFSSCHEENSSRFHEEIYARWFTAKKIEFVEKKYLNSVESLTRPTNTVQIIFSIITEANQKDCFYYSIPGQGKMGAILIKEVLSDSTCPSFPQQPYLWHLKNIIFKKIFVLEKDNSINLSYTEKNIDKKIKITLFNILFDLKSKRKLKRYSSSAEARKELGLTIWKTHKNILQLRDKDPYKQSPNEFYQAIKCHDFNEDCIEVLKNSCHQCPFGFFTVVGRNCPSGKIKYCGPDKCGEKGWPACPRGQFYTDKMDLTRCQDGIGGFCRNGLNAICNGEGILICL